MGDLRCQMDLAMSSAPELSEHLWELIFAHMPRHVASLRCLSCTCRLLAHQASDELIAAYKAHFGGERWAALPVAVQGTLSFSDWMSAKGGAIKAMDWQTLNQELKQSAVAWRNDPRTLLHRRDPFQHVCTLNEAFELVKRALCAKPVSRYPREFVVGLLSWLVFLVNVQELVFHLEEHGHTLSSPCQPSEGSRLYMIRHALYNECDHVHNGVDGLYYEQVMLPGYIKCCELKFHGMWLNTSDLETKVPFHLHKRYEGMKHLRSILAQERVGHRRQSGYCSE